MGVAYFMRFDWLIIYDSAGIIGKSFVQFSGGRVRSLSEVNEMKRSRREHPVIYLIA